jgi:hypothetical protein
MEIKWKNPEEVTLMRMEISEIRKGTFSVMQMEILIETQMVH